MIQRIKNNWFVSGALLFVLAVLPLACGGGGGDTITPPSSINARWMPDNPSPPTNVKSISMGAGGSSGASFTVPIQVSGIDEFFSAAFRVTFDPNASTFVGFSPTGSVIDEGATGPTVIISAIEGAAGELLVTATRQQALPPAPHVPGVNAVPISLLITLNFRVAVATAGSLIGFDLDANHFEVQTCAYAPGDTCTIVPDGEINFHGGSVSAN